MYNSKFQDIVNEAYSKSTSIYGKEYPISNSSKYQPNPYYIGFGNPNSSILIIGKEKGFNIDSAKKKNYLNSQLFLESIANPDDWKKIIENNIQDNNYKYHLESSHFKSALQPYTDKKPDGGHTWNKYQKIVDHIDKPKQKSINSFFFNSFITEVNFRPSKLSKNPKDFGERLEFLKHPFYKSFPIVILACGNYLSKTKIEKIFSVKYESDLHTEKRKKLIEYKSESKKLINTRQLSFDVTDEYLKLVAKIAKKTLDNTGNRCTTQ